MCNGHIVFDCDGTLVSTHYSAFRAISIIVGEMTGREVSFQEVKRKFVPHIETIYKSFGIDYSDKKIRKYLQKRWNELFRSCDFSYDLFPGIRELIYELIRKDYTLYVWTGAYRNYALAILNQVGIMQYFKDISCADDNIAKPDPAGLDYLVGNIQKNQVIVIGDGPTDIIGALNFGCHAIAAVWDEYVNMELLNKAQARFFANRPQDCLPIIERLIN